MRLYSFDLYPTWFSETQHWNDTPKYIAFICIPTNLNYEEYLDAILANVFLFWVIQLEIFYMDPRTSSLIDKPSRVAGCLKKKRKKQYTRVNVTKKSMGRDELRRQHKLASFWGNRKKSKCSYQRITPCLREAVKRESPGWTVIIMTNILGGHNGQITDVGSL